jgi:hypothetical protein
MRHMKRPILLWAASLAALCVALPASADNGHSVKGQLTSITDQAVAVKSLNSIVTTCARVRTSPSLDGYAAGDRVQVVCRKRRGHLALTRIRHLAGATPAVAAHETQPTTFGGAITALSDDSITLRDGDRQLTCTVDSSSPSTADYKVGQHAKVACADGKLTAIAPVTSADAGRYYAGVVSSLDDKSITLQTEHGPATCTIGPGSPSTADVHVGDHVGIGCKASTMQLVLVRKLDGDGGAAPAPAPPTTTEPTHTKTGARGTLSALSDDSVSVTTDGGTVTCRLGPSSPKLGDYAVGDHVAMACLDGVVTEFARVT